MLVTNSVKLTVCEVCEVANHHLSMGKSTLNVQCFDFLNSYVGKLPEGIETYGDDGGISIIQVTLKTYVKAMVASNVLGDRSSKPRSMDFWSDI